MPRSRVNLHGQDGDEFVRGLREIEQELGVGSEFPAEVLAAAERAAAEPRLPELDRTDLDFVTIDPEGSMDLDQAMHLERRGDGFRVHYAIADVAAFVQPGGPIDAEAHRRGQTLYGPTSRIPLHPPGLSEGAASLLPGQLRPALLWTVDLDEMGEQVRVDVVRAMVRSRARYDYASVQQQLQQGTAPEVFGLLREIGELRLAHERERGGVSLPLPDQEVVVGDDGWSLSYRTPLPVENWNAQISLLTGMGCAQIMLYGSEGIVRTLPTPPAAAVDKLRRTAAALGLQWHTHIDYPDFVRSLEPDTPVGAAMLNACTSLLRGAGYVAFDGGVPEHIEHAALASEYAHTTAPLRRLVDRYSGEVAVSLCADTDIPEWVRVALKDLPREMEASDTLAHRYDRAVIDLVEAGVLARHVGETFSGVVTEVDDKDAGKGSVVLSSIAVEARLTSTSGTLPLGEEVLVRLVEADTNVRRVRFELEGTDT